MKINFSNKAQDDGHFLLLLKNEIMCYETNHKTKMAQLGSGITAVSCGLFYRHKHLKGSFWRRGPYDSPESFVQRTGKRKAFG
jgi:hypothetical protein